MVKGATKISRVNLLHGWLCNNHAMATVTFVVDSVLSADAAFDRVVDLSRVTEWDRGIRASSLVYGQVGEVGARYDVSVRGFDGQPASVDYELTTVDRPSSFTIRGSHSDFQADDIVTIEPHGAGSRLTYEASLILLGDNPPLDDDRLATLFAANVDVARIGLEAFLSHEDVDEGRSS